MTTDPSTYRRHRFDNNFQTLLLMTAMIALLAGLGVALGGAGWIVLFLSASLLLLLFTPKFGPALYLRLQRARLITAESNPGLYQILVEVCQRAKLSQIPKLYYLPSPHYNAFAMGSGRNASISITHGLLDKFETRELAGIIAHEVSHIRNKDTVVMSYANMIRRFATFLSRLGLFLVLINLPLVIFGQSTISWLAVLLMIAAPSLATFLQLGLSRTREYAADATAAYLTGDPKGLAMALARLKAIHDQKIGGWKGLLFPVKREVPSLMRTHPPTKDRIERLAKLVAIQQP